MGLDSLLFSWVLAQDVLMVPNINISLMALSHQFFRHGNLCERTDNCKIQMGYHFYNSSAEQLCFNYPISHSDLGPVVRGYRGISLKINLYIDY